MKFLLVFLLLLSPALFAQDDDGGDGRMPLRHVCGVVIDSQSAPIPRATLNASRDGKQIASVQTNDKGEFSFDKLKAGTYQLQIAAPAFETLQLPVKVASPARECSLPMRIPLKSQPASPPAR